ncbi:hypothetical protein FIBSPDRAFT_903784 [Athelia psychrophila]|uniref:Uncharacterized protein n=1 Tax=Athelia psychrophila TaxID=1759441 RepID=A0A167VJ77_9AGAM|nr:hypothetical protein FIBSPDRAFT_903784 [Fibularhizoctonia sp. CBS 109695]
MNQPDWPFTKAAVCESGRYAITFVAALQIAGRVLQEQQTASDTPDNHWAPFLNEEEWGLAEWLIMETTQKGRDRFLKLPIARPGWTCETVHMIRDCLGPANTPMVEELEFWQHDPVECVQELIGNPAFLEPMSFTPEDAYEDAGGQTRVFDEMWTSDWWWSMQVP